MINPRWPACDGVTDDTRWLQAELTAKRRERVLDEAVATVAARGVGAVSRLKSTDQLIFTVDAADAIRAEFARLWAEQC